MFMNKEVSNIIFKGSKIYFF